LRNINNFLVKAAHWKDVDQWSLHSMPHQVVSWLLESDSLTARIKASATEPFSVCVYGQGLSKPFLHDARCLHQPLQHVSLIREVTLSVGNEAVVFARTTLPRNTARQLQGLTHLGNKPLGEVIFSYPDLRRVGLDLAKIEVMQLDDSVKQASASATHIWARRNRYQINHCDFLVSEFFLPALYKL
jgi:chorismate--pyruvate lyase